MSPKLALAPSREAWDVVVVGGGVSGLSAAARLAAGGAGSVLVLEREPEPGGAPRHIHNLSFGWREFHRPMLGPDYARRLAARAAHAGAEIVVGAGVTALDPAGALTLACREGIRHIQARAVCLATGAREKTRHGRLVTGARPFGVMTYGALQRYVHFAGLVPFRRPLVVGSELISLAALRTLAAAGIRPAALIEEQPRPVAPALVCRAACLLYGAAFLPDTRLARIVGQSRVEGVELEHRGGTRFLDCDGVLFTGDFLPEAHLVQAGGLGFDPGTRGPATDQWQRVYAPDGSASAIVACGNVLRPVRGSWSCSREGELAAQAVLAARTRRLPDPATAVPVSPGPGVRFVWPQRLCPGAGGPTALQAQLAEPRRGSLRVLADGRPVASRSVDAVPGKLLTIRLDPAALGNAGSLTVAMEDPA